MKGILFFLLAFMNTANAQLSSPKLEYTCTLEVYLDTTIIVGESIHGLRKIVPILGGKIEGPQINGIILNGGADWQNIRKDGVAEIDAQYQIKTNDGIIIYLKNTGLRIATPEIAAKLAKGENVDANSYYFRTVLHFEAPIGKYDWLNKAIFVCTGARLPNTVQIIVWKLL